jgi:hypothetical protein
MDKHQERYLAKVIRGDGCWSWRDAKVSTGYGAIHITTDGKRVVKLAHRVSYEIHKGEIPAGKDVMHLCHNPICSNPEHLALGSRRENMQTSFAAGRLQRKIPLQDLPLIAKKRAYGETLQSIGDLYGCTKQAVRHMLLSHPKEVLCLA